MTTEAKLQDYITGRLTAADRATFEAEMKGDPRTAAEVTALLAARNAFAADASEAQERTDSGWSRLEAAITEPAIAAAANTNRPIRLSLTQAAGLAVAAVALWQFLAVPQIASTAEGFMPVSAQGVDAGVQVFFAERAEMADVIATLSDLGGVVVDGPSAIGLFKISFENTSDRDAALAVLKSMPELIKDVMVD